MSFKRSFKRSFKWFHRTVATIGILSLASGCAFMHHVQVGDVDNTRPVKNPIDVKMSETGINLRDIEAIAKAAGGKRNAIGKGSEYLQYFQMGPKTGNPVYAKDYADNVLEVVLTQCPSGNVTGLMSIRESTSYPVVSGEIVKITGWCLE